MVKVQKNLVLIDNVPTANIKSTHFLGLIIDENLLSYSLPQRLTKILESFGKMCYLLNAKVSLNLYYSMIYPFITYSNIAWSSNYFSLAKKSGENYYLLSSKKSLITPVSQTWHTLHFSNQQTSNCSICIWFIK